MVNDMRAGRDQEMLELEGKLVGVNLGADYCAEHEWGIKGIQRELGIDITKLGLDKRRISNVSKDLEWLENIQIGSYKKDKARWSGIWFGKVYSGGHYFDSSAYGDLYSQWSENGFCILASTPEKVAQLKQVYEAFARNDIAIWLGGGGVFQNAGLCIAIASNLPKDVTDKWYQADVDANKIREEFAATGIEEKLKKAGKSYFALSPRRDKDGSLMYWLNPMQQDKNNYGWFKLDDLDAWARDEGPIPMKNKKR